MNIVILNDKRIRHFFRRMRGCVGGVEKMLVGMVLAAMFISPAYAQLSQVNTLLSTIQTTLLGVGGVVCSISIIWAGFRMMFQHARFGDIANVFIGGVFVGCATVIAAMLIPTA
jgi:type IV secretion system protein VirB2